MRTSSGTRRRWRWATASGGSPTASASTPARTTAEVHVSLPLDTRHARVFDRRRSLDPDLTVEQLHSPQRRDARHAASRRRRRASYQLTAQIDIHLSERPGWRANLPEATLTSQLRAAPASRREGDRGVRPGGAPDAGAAARRAGEQGRSWSSGCSRIACETSAPAGTTIRKTAAAVLDQGRRQPAGPRLRHGGPVPGGEDSRPAGDRVRDQARQRRPPAHLGRNPRRRRLGVVRSRGRLSPRDAARFHARPPRRRRRSSTRDEATDLAVKYAIAPHAAAVGGLRPPAPSSAGHPRSRHACRSNCTTC